MVYLIIIWDYDSAIGQVNASYPYNFREEKLLEEIKNVDRILEIGLDYHLSMTFACVGFAAEIGHYPYHVPEQISTIYKMGHEVASHSWKHEWFPYLESEQIIRSLKRSKYILERCIDEPGAVTGFVPPFNRPMSWYGKGAFSLGDRTFGPTYPGASLGSLLRYVKNAGYQWCRVSYRPIWMRFFPNRANRLGSDQISKFNHIFCISHQHVGFDQTARQMLNESVGTNQNLILSAHPSGLSRSSVESMDNLLQFVKLVANYQSKGLLQTVNVSRYLEIITHS
jgi:hypothetical protein